MKFLKNIFKFLFLYVFFFGVCLYQVNLYAGQKIVVQEEGARLQKEDDVSQFKIVASSIVSDVILSIAESIFNAIKIPDLKISKLPLIKDIKFPRPLQRLLDETIVRAPKFKQYGDGFIFSGQMRIFGVDRKIQIKVAMNEKAQIYHSLLFGLPDGWKFSDVIKLVSEQVGGWINKFEIVQFNKLALVVSSLDYIDPEWGEVKKGINVIGSVKIAGILEDVNKLFGNNLSKMSLQFAGVLRPPRGIGSSFAIKIPTGFTLVRNIFGLKPAVLELAIEEDITQVPKPVVKMIGGVWIGIPRNFVPPIQLQKVSFYGMFALIPNQIELVAQTSGKIEDAFGLKGLTIGDLTLGASWNFVLTAGKVGTGIGSLLALLPTGLTLGGEWGLNGSIIKLGTKFGIGETGLEDLTISGKGTVRLRDVVNFWIDKIEPISKLLDAGYDRKKIINQIPDVKMEDAVFIINPKETTIGLERIPKQFKIQVDKLELIPGLPAAFEFNLREFGIDAYGALLREIRWPEKGDPILLITKSRQKEPAVTTIRAKKAKGPYAGIHIRGIDPVIYLDGLIVLNAFGKIESESRVFLRLGEMHVKFVRNIYDVFESDVEIKAKIFKHFSVDANLTSKGIEQFTKALLDSGNKLIEEIKSTLEIAKKKAVEDINRWKRIGQDQTQDKIYQLNKDIRFWRDECKRRFPHPFWHAIPRGVCLNVNVTPRQIARNALIVHQKVTLQALGGVAIGVTMAGMNVAKCVNEVAARVLTDTQQHILNIARFSGKILDIKELKLQTNDKDILQGKLPKVSIVGTLFGRRVALRDLQIDFKNPKTIVETLVRLVRLK